MPVLELFHIKVKVLKRRQSLLAIPRIGQQNAANVPEDSLNARQGTILSVLAVQSDH